MLIYDDLWFNNTAQIYISLTLNFMHGATLWSLISSAITIILILLLALLWPSQQAMFLLQSHLVSTGCLSKRIMKLAATASLSNSSAKHQAREVHHHTGSPQGKRARRLSITSRFTIAAPLTFLYSSSGRPPGLPASALLDSAAAAIAPIQRQLAEVPAIVKRTN